MSCLFVNSFSHLTFLIPHSCVLYCMYICQRPGFNSFFAELQILFSGSSFPRLLLGFHVSLIILGMLVLLRTTEWYQLVSISSLITTSLYTFIRLGNSIRSLLSILALITSYKYKLQGKVIQLSFVWILGRDYLTLLKIYDAERIIWTHSNTMPNN